jgi:hypothetical protein
MRGSKKVVEDRAFKEPVSFEAWLEELEAQVNHVRGLGTWYVIAKQRKARIKPAKKE